jgi:hypothetical protein
VGIFKLNTEVYQDFEGGTWYVDASPALSFRIPHNAWPKFWLFGKFCGNESGGMGKWPP